MMYNIVIFLQNPTSITIHVDMRIFQKIFLFYFFLSNIMKVSTRIRAYVDWWITKTAGSFENKTENEPKGLLVIKIISGYVIKSSIVVYLCVLRCYQYAEELLGCLFGFFVVENSDTLEEALADI